MKECARAWIASIAARQPQQPSGRLGEGRRGPFDFAQGMRRPSTRARRPSHTTGERRGAWHQSTHACGAIAGRGRPALQKREAVLCTAWDGRVAGVHTSPASVVGGDMRPAGTPALHYAVSPLRCLISPSRRSISCSRSSEAKRSSTLSPLISACASLTASAFMTLCFMRSKVAACDG
jgi:hypothetical protein